jgi:hypothetical protein
MSVQAGDMMNRVSYAVRESPSLAHFSWVRSDRSDGDSTLQAGSGEGIASFGAQDPLAMNVGSFHATPLRTLVYSSSSRALNCIGRNCSTRYVNVWMPPRRQLMIIDGTLCSCGISWVFSARSSLLESPPLFLGLPVLW